MEKTDDSLDLWTVDFEMATATHKSGFVARFHLLPMTDAQLKAAEDAGLTGIGQCKAADQREFGIFMEAGRLQKFFDQLKKKFSDAKAHLLIAKLSREAGEVFLLTRNTGRH